MNLLLLAAALLPQETVIDFESLPDGSPACRSCALSGQFASLGVRFRFRSASTGDIPARLIDSSAYDPPGPPPNHSATAALTDHGFATGILEIRFAAPVERVLFQLRAASIVEHLVVRAYRADGSELPETSIERTAGEYRRFTGAPFHEEKIRIADVAGISRIELDGAGPPGHIVLLDDLRFLRS